MNTKDLLNHIQEFVDKLNSTNSSTAKIEILKTYQNDDAIRKILFYVYNPYMQYYVTSDTIKKNSKLIAPFDVYDEIFPLLSDLTDRNQTGHAALECINRFIDSNKEHSELIYNILDKDLKTRVGVTTINKVFTNLIPTFDVALAKEYEPKDVDFKDKWYMSRKLDGVRCICIIDKNGNPTFYSRQGQIFETLGTLAEEVKTLGLSNTVLDGEVCLMNPDGSDDFQGVMKQIRRKNHTIKNPRYLLFDMLTIHEFDDKKSKRTLSERLEVMDCTIGMMPELRCISILNQMLATEDLFIKFQEEASANGWEGIMIRKDVGYEGKRGKNLLKVKSFHDAEYIVKRIETGPFRHIVNGKEVTSDMLTNIIIEHKGYEVSVGSGFSLDQRQKYFADPNELLGKTVTVKYFEETNNQNGGISLRFPTVKVIYESERNV